MKTINPIGRLHQRQDGASAIEFALILPIMLTLFVGILEVSHFIYTKQKTQSAASNIINIINLHHNINTAQLESITKLVPEIAEPITIGPEQYRVVVTAIQRDLMGQIPYIRWQKAFGNSNAGASHFKYTENGTQEVNRITSSQLGGFTFSPGDQVIVVEVYMYYHPILNIKLMDDWLHLKDVYLYRATPPARPRTGSFQFHPDDLV